MAGGALTGLQLSQDLMNAQTNTRFGGTTVDAGIRGKLNRMVLAAGLALAAAGGCSQQPATPVEAAAAPIYDTTMPMDEVMIHVMEPAAYQFWGGWGVVVDEKGPHDLRPTTDERWKEVENGAATVAQATNILMLPGYARAPQAEWNRYAQGVAKLALEGKAAAERKDYDGIGKVGEQLDAACDACHEKFPPLAP
ncbi:MAG: hypothetical protein B7Y99_13375 [Caulobacterales bacterium 32-69-10]|nr:MAG: hypothetical protein B7Y99_13375 [Caulobacterales bacterium 32-69-10]